MTKVALTLGTFDGVHLGHQALLEKLRAFPERHILTFSNHPAEVLHQTPVLRITTLPHRLALLKQAGFSSVHLIPFTRAFAHQSPEAFLTHLQQKIPFSHLILGHDAVIGHNRTGSPEHLQHMAKKLNFQLTYIAPVRCDETLVSSSHIRILIQQGNLSQASRFLNRSYSLMAPVERGEKNGRLLGFQTANLPVDGLALPPTGVYVVKTVIDQTSYLGVANLGQAPTLHAHRRAILEVHLLDFDQDLYGQTLDITFKHFLRPEKRFDSLSALKKQIASDIQTARLCS